MKRIIKLQKPGKQTVITVPKKLAEKLDFGKHRIGRIWINEDGNLEIEVLNLDQEKNRRSGVFVDDKNHPT